MKKIIMMAAIALLGFNAVAQEIKIRDKQVAERKFTKEPRYAHRAKQKANITPEQRAELQVKRMALQLDLSDKQQRKLLDLNKKRIKDFKDVKLTKDSQNKFEIEKNRLDAKLEYQKSFKKILNKEQLQKWETLQAERKTNRFKHERSQRFKSKEIKERHYRKIDSVKKA